MEPRRARQTARAVMLIPFFAIASTFIVLSVVQLAVQTFAEPKPTAAPSASH